MIVLFASCGTTFSADLAEIRETLREIQTSVDSIRVVYKTGPGLELTSTVLQSGARRGLIYETPSNVSAHFFDGEFGYQVMYKQSDSSPRVVSQIRKENEIPGVLLGVLAPPKWWGRPLGYTGKPLWELLGDSAQVVGHSEEGEFHIVEIDLGEVEEYPGGQAHYSCRLVVERDYAPIEIRRVDKSPEPTTSVYTVETFREVPNELIGTQVWFPENMACDVGTRSSRLELVSVTLNPVLDASEFVPQAEANTRIVDKTKSSEPVFDPVVADELVSEARDLGSREGTGVVAHQPSASFGSWMWMGIAAVFSVIAGVARWTRSR